MLPLSCSNCWYNGLQVGASVGLNVGYCSEHRCLLERPFETTCGRLMRKDLLLESARAQGVRHRERYSVNCIHYVRDAADARDAISTNGQALSTLREDRVGNAVADYGELGSKIESLARLSALDGARPEIAMLSLARGYVNRCMDRGGKWTSGLHLLWWTKKRLDREPEIAVADLPAPSPLPLERRVAVAKWLVIMLRLSFVDDVAHHATPTRHAVRKLKGIAEDAAAANQNFNPVRLRTWVRTHAIKRMDGALPAREYATLSRELHQD